MALTSLSINLGFLLGYVSSYFLGKLSLRLGWRTMLGVTAIPSLALAILMLKMEESPRWLVMQGRIGEAKKVLSLVSNSDLEAEKRLRAIKIAAGIDENCDQVTVPVPKKTRSGGGALKELLCNPSPTIRRILIEALGVHAFQHLCGIDVILLCCPRIFERAGIAEKSKLLPETKGRSLEDMEALFGKHRESEIQMDKAQCNDP